MRVSLYEVDQNTAEQTLVAADCDLAECFPDDPHEIVRAEGELERAGRFWAGGGAAQLFLIMRHPGKNER